MTVSLEDAFTGLQEDISITVPASCDSCSGSGAAVEPSQAPVVPVAGLVGFVHNKVFSLLNVPATPVRALVKLYQIPAGIVVVRAGSKKIKPCRSQFRRVLIPVPGLGCLEKVKRGYVVVQLVIFTFL